jgi:hypothetical protein
MEQIVKNTYEIPSIFNRLISPVIIKIINFIEYDLRQLKAITGENNKQIQTQKGGSFQKNKKKLSTTKKNNKLRKKTRKNKTNKRTK